MRRTSAVLAVGVVAAVVLCPAVAGASTFDDIMAGFMSGTWNTFADYPADPTVPDKDWDGVPDPYMIALMAAAIDSDPTVAAAYQTNLSVASDWIAHNGWGMNAGDAVQVACYATFDTARMCIDWYYYVGDPYRSQFVAVPSLAPAADFDNDGTSNADEYAGISGVSGTMADFAASATNPLLHGQPASALPVGGLVGLGVLAGLCAAGGALKLRKKH